MQQSIKKNSIYMVNWEIYDLIDKQMKSGRPEVRGTADFYGGAYPPSKTSPSYALTTLIIFRCGRTGRERYFHYETRGHCCAPI